MTPTPPTPDAPDQVTVNRYDLQTVLAGPPADPYSGHASLRPYNAAGARLRAALAANEQRAATALERSGDEGEF